VFDESHDFESCAICERTILRGERVSDYVTPDGAPERVCSLCRERAEAAAWIPAARASALGAEGSQRRARGLALRERLSRAAALVRPPRPEPAAPSRRMAEAEEDQPPAAPPRRREGVPSRPTTKSANGDVSATKPRTAKPPTTKPQTAAGRRAAGGGPRPGVSKRTTSTGRAGPPKRRARPRRTTRESPERRLRRAVETFNVSDEARVVAGLVRSLGQPRATVRNLSARPPRVSITVAWELSWYRWEVGLDGEQVPVREVDKGDEVTELDEEERNWNARVAEDGTLRLELAAARKAANAKQASAADEGRKGADSPDGGE
jgi:hypothetical protein